MHRSMTNSSQLLKKDCMLQSLRTAAPLTKVDNWGVQDFAYEINHMKKGHYVVMYCTANNEGIEEFQRLCRINNSVIRVMVIKKEEEK